MKKVHVTFDTQVITFPIDFLGRPTTVSSWVAKASLQVTPESLTICVVRKKFYFDKPSLFKENEKNAMQGFLRKNEFEVKQWDRYSLNHHIKAKDFMEQYPIFSGTYEFKVEASIIDLATDWFTLELDIREFPKDYDNIRQVRSLLVG